MKRFTTAARTVAVALAALSTASLCGCTTYFGNGQRQVMQEREDYLLLKEDLRKLSGRIEGVEMQTDRLRAAQDQVERQQADRLARDAAQLSALTERVAALERKVAEVDAARQKDRREIIDALSRKITEIIQQNAATAAARRSSHAGSEYGVEHPVKPGETLSTIAAAYGVKQSAIIEANHLSNPDVLRVGQVIFIPDR